MQCTYIHTLYYDSSILGYSAVIYNNEKYTIKLHRSENFLCILQRAMQE